MPYLTSVILPLNKTCCGRETADPQAEATWHHGSNKTQSHVSWISISHHQAQGIKQISQPILPSKINKRSAVVPQGGCQGCCYLNHQVIRWRLWKTSTPTEQIPQATALIHDQGQQQNPLNLVAKRFPFSASPVTLPHDCSYAINLKTDFFVVVK